MGLKKRKIGRFVASGRGRQTGSAKPDPLVDEALLMIQSAWQNGVDPQSYALDEDGDEFFIDVPMDELRGNPLTKPASRFQSFVTRLRNAMLDARKEDGSHFFKERKKEQGKEVLFAVIQTTTLTDPEHPNDPPIKGLKLWNAAPKEVKHPETGETVKILGT